MRADSTGGSDHPRRIEILSMNSLARSHLACRRANLCGGYQPVSAGAIAPARRLERRRPAVQFGSLAAVAGVSQYRALGRAHRSATQLPAHLPAALEIRKRSFMANQLTGGCLCGACVMKVRQTAMAGNCHCRDCQRSGGSAFVAVMVVPASALKIEGQVKYYESKADSGNPSGFCPMRRAPVRQVHRRSATRDGCRRKSRQTEPVSTDIGFFTSSRRRWDNMNPKLPSSPTCLYRLHPVNLASSMQWTQECFGRAQHRTE